MSGASQPVVDEALLRECVHCGLCLDACPTYVELGTEMDSPRGRIHLVAALQNGRVELDSEVVRHLDLCLGCRGCETACPSGVRYGQILEGARAHVERTYRRPWRERLKRWAILQLFPHPRRLRALLRPVGALRAVGLWSLAEHLFPVARLVPEQIPAAFAETSDAAPGTRRVGLLRGCVASVLFADTNAAAARLLRRGGLGVTIPTAQSCCGALHLHSGDVETARRLARQMVDSFAGDLEAVAVTAAGCGATMKEYGELLGDDPRYAEKARAFAARVRDVIEVLADVELPPVSTPIQEKVVYHDACHLAHGQGVRAAPRRLLSEVAGAELVPLAESELCCGSAGSYNLSEPAMAAALAARKADNIVASGATCVAVANPGCALQIRAALRARGARLRVAHPVELLDECYRR